MAELTASTANTTGKYRRKQLSTRIDLTAMVDLAFLLITFFILTTTLSKSKMFSVAMPDNEGRSEPISEKRTMTICLGKNDQVVSFLGMTEKPLTEPKISNYDKTVFVRQSLI